MLNDNQCADFLFPHAQTSHYHGHDIIVLQRFFLRSAKETGQCTDMPMRSQSQKKTDFIVITYRTNGRKMSMVKCLSSSDHCCFICYLALFCFISIQKNVFLPASNFRAVVCACAVLKKITVKSTSKAINLFFMVYSKIEF